jgi:shikimate kinase
MGQSWLPALIAHERSPEIIGMTCGRAVFLVGFMGAGKTSVGRVMGHRLGWRFEDLDDRIQSRERRSIEDIFRECGEIEFRRMELAALTEFLEQLPSLPPVILALGGGAFAQELTAARLQRTGFPIVFLDGSAEALWERCTAQVQARPLRTEQAQFAALYASRRPAYMRATVRVDTCGKDVQSVASEVIARLQLWEQGKELCE